MLLGDSKKAKVSVGIFECKISKLLLMKISRSGFQGLVAVFLSESAFVPLFYDI